MDAEETQPPNSSDRPPVSPLPRGRRDLPPEEVERHQRERIVAAVAEVIAEHGYGGLTIARIISGARISRTTFYGHFANKNEALVASYEDILARYLATVKRVCAAEADWPEKVKAGIEVTLELAEAEPAQLQLLASAFFAVDRTLAGRLQAVYEQLPELLAGGRRAYPEAEALPPVTEQALIGAIASLLSRSLLDGEPRPLAGIGSQLAELTLLPYIGIAEARLVAAS